MSRLFIRIQKSETSSAASTSKSPTSEGPLPPADELPAEHNQRDAEGRADERHPTDPVQPLAGKERSGSAQQHRHAAYHERRMRHRGERESVELYEVLHRYAEKRCDEQQPPLSPIETRAMAKRKRQQSDACKCEAVEHHVAHAHDCEHDLAEVEACTPEAAGQRACAITQPKGGGARVLEGGGHATTLRANGRAPQMPRGLTRENGARGWVQMPFRCR